MLGVGRGSNCRVKGGQGQRRAQPCPTRIACCLVRFPCRQTGTHPCPSTQVVRTQYTQDPMTASARPDPLLRPDTITAIRFNLPHSPPPREAPGTAGALIKADQLRGVVSRTHNCGPIAARRPTGPALAGTRPVRHRRWRQDRLCGRRRRLLLQSAHPGRAK